MVEYWRKISVRAWKDAAKGVGLESREKLVIAVIGQIILAALIYLALGEGTLKSSEPVRLLSAAVPLAIFPGLFFWNLATVPPKLDREREAEIEILALQKESVESLRARRVSLGQLLSQAEHIKGQCASETPVDEHMVSEWFQRTRIFLANDLGEEYLHTFESDAGTPPLVLTAQAVPERNRELWAWANRRAFRLHAILEAMPTRS